MMKRGDFFHIGFETMKTKLELEPLVDMESSLYYNGAKHLFLESGVPQPIITEPYIYEGKLIVEQTYPIVIDGVFKGIGGVDRSLESIDQFITKISEENHLDLFLISSRGRYIATSISGKSYKTTAIDDSPYRDLFEPFYSNRDSKQFTIASDPTDGLRYYFASAPIPTGEWLVILRESESEIVSPIWAKSVIRRALFIIRHTHSVFAELVIRRFLLNANSARYERRSIVGGRRFKHKPRRR